MKIKVSKIKPNPYRRMKTYPIDKDKVKRLETSIQETTFWDNIIARPHPTKKGFFQLGYGHHRLIALRNLSVDTIDIPIRNIDDATMLRIMANENLEWNHSPAVINETVHAARDFLNKELAKYATWEECLNESIKALFTGIKGDFKHCKTKGVGQTIILKFLGSNWKQWMVQEALETIQCYVIDKKTKTKTHIERNAVEKFPTMSQAREFKKAVVDYKIPKKEQNTIAQKITRGSKPIGTRDIRNAVKKATKIQPQITQQMRDIESALKKLDSMTSSVTFLADTIRQDLKKMGVTQLQGIKAFFVLYNVILAAKALNNFAKFVGGKDFADKKETKLIKGEVK